MMFRSRLLEMMTRSTRDEMNAQLPDINVPIPDSKSRLGLADGVPFTQVIERRREVCEGCEHIAYAKAFGNSIFPYCGKCKCPIWSKTKIMSASCPAGYW